MKRAALLLTLLTLTLTLPTLADDERHQSYFSYDDGGTIVKSGEDGSEVEVHRNMPVYPGDEVVTARRGRAEVRLSDGNIIGIDRATALHFRSILDAYEGDSDETVAELRYGKVGVQRTDIGRDHVRLDTENASYVAENEAVYSVETDSRGRDRVTVFSGSVEVRTPSRVTRIRKGESGTVDDRGVYDLIDDQRAAADDFERWFLRRAERFGSYNNRYMDRRLSYWSDDLDDYGTWVMVNGIGWSWRPVVSAGWRPYYNGYWYHRYGCLTWVSYDPWGWGPYHYGRWAYDPGYGWVWVPGYGYSPAWVYWTYGSGYVGWAPSGWWDCYRPYYSWTYQPYRNYYGRMGFGFYGRVRISDFDLRPWTFMDSHNIFSTRVDRAALTTDAIKQRLGRSRDGFATVSGGNARFTREEWNDPADAIRRRGLDGRTTGRETGAPPTDMTPFFRRDGDVGGAVRDRVVRNRGGSSGGSYTGGVPTHTIGGGNTSVAPIGGGSVAPIGRGSVAPIGGGSGSGIDNRRNGDSGGSGSSGRIDRGSSPPTVSDPGDSTSGSDSNRSSGNWRNRDRSGGGDTPAVTQPGDASGGSTERPRNDSWRGRVRSDSPSSGGSSGSSGSSSPGSSTSSGSSSDVPRRVIDRIGGARIYPRDGNSGSGSSGSSGGSSSTRDRGSSSSGSRDSGSSSRDRGSSTRDSGSSHNSGGGSSTHESSPPPRSEPRSDPPPSSSGRSSGESSGRVKRD